MGKRTREIIALVILALLGLAVLGAMSWYIFVGHSWNVAATRIDETIGEMDGYTVILFEGTTLPQNELSRLSDSQPMLDDQNRPSSQMHVEDTPPSEPLRASTVASSYRQKGATVFVLHPERASDYNPPLVLNKNGFWIGVFAIDGATSHASAQYKASTLHKRGVDFVIGIANDARFIEQPASSIDILLCAADEELSSGGEYHENMFCVDSPYIGEVQSLIISPSNVIMSKTVTSL